MLSGNGEIIGSIREVQVVSGLPARVSIERLDQLDDESHTINFSMIGGDHALKNYHSTITLHHESEDDGKTILVEAYVVDVPNGNSKEDTCLFVETIIRCNHRSLAWITEKMVLAGSSSR
ncbi:Abscisic acid receptor pyr1 [Thalictrum thalictroides]|uniref:Abscisic acid receptor pyr1 n=1 Tax=Thalictrum thalictroides TaxID=46969 RepID=A0A7J6VN34_THATH|nr:Abscisic acid receptor pyr1 [Thalictrum thalictroides]